MKILLISASDGGGGANLVPFHLMQQYFQGGHDAWMAVGRKVTTHDRVVTIPEWGRRCSFAFVWNAVEQWTLKLEEKSIKGAWRWRDIIKRARRIGVDAKEQLGRENFAYPGTWRLMEWVENGVDIIHCHMLHGGYFDLRFLSALSKRVPVLLTLHDEWLYTGHCAHAMACERWVSGCGCCPDLERYPALKKDGTAKNWRRKKRIYANSNLFLISPSNWLMERASRSILRGYHHQVIPNGVDLSVFRSRDKNDARTELGWPLNQQIILTVANQIRTNVYKDWATLEKAISLLGRNHDKPVRFVCLGEEGKGYTVGNIKVVFEPFADSAQRVASYYQAADIFVHTARADTYPTTILEAMACGLPVVGTSVGGVPEQILDGETGLLVPPASPVELEKAIRAILSDEVRYDQMCKASLIMAKNMFDIRRSATEHINYYTYAMRCFAKQSNSRNGRSGYALAVQASIR